VRRAVEVIVEQGDGDGDDDDGDMRPLSVL